MVARKAIKGGLEKSSVTSEQPNNGILISKKKKMEKSGEAEKMERERHEWFHLHANRAYLEVQYLTKLYCHLLEAEDRDQVIDFHGNKKFERLKAALLRRSSVYPEPHDESVRGLAEELTIELSEAMRNVDNDLYHEASDSASDEYEDFLEFETEEEEIMRTQGRKVKAVTDDEAELKLVEKDTADHSLRRSFEELKRIIREHQTVEVEEARELARLALFLKGCSGEYRRGYNINLEGSVQFKEMRELLRQRLRQYSEGRGALNELVDLVVDLQKKFGTKSKDIRVYVEEQVREIDGSD